jgi:hypothetical protein
LKVFFTFYFFGDAATLIGIIGPTRNAGSPTITTLRAILVGRDTALFDLLISADATPVVDLDGRHHRHAQNSSRRMSDFQTPLLCATFQTMTPINVEDQKRLSGYTGAARSKRTFTNKEIISALQTAAKQIKGVLKRETYQEYYEKHRNVPHSYTIIRRYGRWNEALKAAKLPVNKRATYRSKFTAEDCVDALLEARKELGHLPSGNEYSDLWWSKLKAKGHPSVSTIRLKFTRWRDASTEAAKHIV